MSETKTTEQHQKKVQERQRWAGTDPFTLISACREGIYELPSASKPERDEIVARFEEAFSRLEQQSRALLGTSTLVGVGGQQQPV